MLLILMRNEYMTGNSEDCAGYCVWVLWLTFREAKKILP